MKERLKTFLLISLVSISVILAKNLWLQTPEELFEFAAELGDDEFSSYVLSDMILPNKYLLNFSETNHTIMYDDSKYGMWSKSRDNLIEVLNREDIEITEITDDEYLDYHNVKSVVFYFSSQINTYILTRAWDVKDANNLVDIMPNMDSIYIYLGNSNPFFIFSDNDKHIAISYEGMDTSALIDEINKIAESQDHTRYYSMKEYGVKSDIFIPVEIDYTLPEIYVANDTFSYSSKEKKQLAERFFDTNIDYIREIEEGNGSTIYENNQKILKLNTNGIIEYFHAIENRVTERNLFLSLSTAVQFLSEKAEVQEGMYLAGIQEISQDENVGYRLFFRYRVRGIPVILGNLEISEYVNIEVFNDHIRNYKYYARKDMNKIPSMTIDEDKILAALDVLDINYDFFQDIYLSSNDIQIGEEPDDIIDRVLASIEDITLAYYDPCLKEQDEKLIPVWAIRYMGTTYAFDANNGILVYER
ncbi:MAG TPA: hypothetical protein VFC79_02875 [Tissierellaceae bacterium]|nr:hypothetical protein [Tissierellaceae bacterium]